MYNTRRKPKVNYGLWVIMMYQRKFILGITIMITNKNFKSTILVNVADNRGAYTSVIAEHIWNISVTFPQFCCEAKTVLKTLRFKQKEMS